MSQFHASVAHSSIGRGGSTDGGGTARVLKEDKQRNAQNFCLPLNLFKFSRSRSYKWRTLRCVSISTSPSAQRMGFSPPLVFKSHLLSRSARRHCIVGSILLLLSSSSSSSFAPIHSVCVSSLLLLGLGAGFARNTSPYIIKLSSFNPCLF